MTQYMGHEELPPGDYQSSDAWTKLIGAQLNGDWTIVVTDLWPIDYGKIHQWSIAFNPAIVQDCSGPVIQ
jgi:subtilisin-like proprotein convertase family protein